MSLEPEAFEDGGDMGLGWDILGEHWPVNPRVMVPPAAFAVVRIYRYGGWGGMAPGHLPDAGAVADQSAWLMSAMGIVAAAEAAFHKRSKGE